MLQLRPDAAKQKAKNKVLLYSTGNYIQYPVVNHNGKEYIYKRERWQRGPCTVSGTLWVLNKYLKPSAKAGEVPGVW